MDTSLVYPPMKVHTPSPFVPEGYLVYTLSVSQAHVGYKHNRVRIMPISSKRVLVAEQLLTENDISAYTSIPVKTLRNWRQLWKGPPYHKLNGNIRYRLSEVLAWIKKRRVTPGVGRPPQKILDKRRRKRGKGPKKVIKNVTPEDLNGQMRGETLSESRRGGIPREGLVFDPLGDHGDEPDDGTNKETAGSET